MSIQPEGEDLRKATKWISTERMSNQEAKLYDLIQQASIKFDLPPTDTEFLMRFFSNKDTK
ncbi:MAG: hypothetical protein JRF28_09855 [Deltaproteobacteria bacterium]|nr:hypothetical protein [Deltaproteobacteria bacterium]